MQMKLICGSPGTMRVQGTVQGMAKTRSLDLLSEADGKTNATRGMARVYNHIDNHIRTQHWKRSYRRQIRWRV